MTLLDIVIIPVVVYISCFLVYWKWKLIFKYLMTKEQQADHARMAKNAFEFGLKIFRVKYRK